jgi:hypothetical protein
VTPSPKILQPYLLKPLLHNSLNLQCYAFASLKIQK